MKNMKLKKIVVACQTAAMTTVTCTAVSTQASDTELYKAPQTSQTTIMFMLDVSGSMDATDGVGSTRLARLKDGMTKLLQGDANTEALPDRLVTGLATFDRYTGRIKLEAKPLGDEKLIPNAPVYKETQPKTGTSTQAVYSKVVEQGQYYDDGDRYWSTYDITISESQGPIINSTLIDTGTKTFEECIGWDANNNCTGWLATTKRLSDFGTVVSNMTNVNETTSWSGGGATQVSITKPDECIKSNKWGCQTWRYYRNVKQLTYKGPRTGAVTLDQVTTYTGTAKDTHRKKMLRQVSALQLGGATPTAFAYAEAAAYMMGQTTLGEVSSGFGESQGLSLIQNGVTYLAPTSVSSTKQCNTQGIYFLTDGEPNYNNNNGNYTTFMKKTLESKGSTFSCGTNQLVTTGNSWGCIGNYTKALLDTTKNPAGVTIKTAVVGFGSDFNGTSTDSDVINAKKWGEVGQGGWYSGASAQDVVTSVKAFLKKLQKYIPPVTTGSVTIPVDNLDTQNIQPWGYFPQFDPAPDAKVTTWIGNLKKYQVLNNVLKDKDGNNVMITSGDSKGTSVDDPYDYWADPSLKKTIVKIITENGVEREEEKLVRIGGMLSRTLLGTATGTPPAVIERKIFTDRKIALAVDNVTYSPNPIGSNADLVQIKSADLKTNNIDNNFSYDTKRGYLAALFGYNVNAGMAQNLTSASNTEFNNFLTNTNATLRQMGAVMHSKPIMLTQEGKTKYDTVNKVITYEDRDDLIVFGTTQGLLHVVRAGKNASDTDAGKEVFVFAPNEVIENQASGFLNQDNQSSTLGYGIDGQWTAYTEYVTKSGTNANEPVVTVNGGKQWIYGGLRMGGKSYYALDLSNVTTTGGTPKLKFHINPTGTCSATNGLGCMGQSWSKPTIGWVNWQGKRKLVMFVGGGYDSRYESSADNTPSGTDAGAGVYMFDANDGSLLWWASANAGSSNTATNQTYVENMTRSVVSGIKTIDRNSDGIVDNLYFGDLGGQLWRVDLDASASSGKTDGTNFAKRIVRILDASGTDAPRFYVTPTFTIHNSTSGMFAAITIGSGNLSFPMSAKTNSNDAVYVVYDKDVARRNLSVLKDSSSSTELYTKDVKVGGTLGKNLLKNADGNTIIPIANGGWYYPVGSKKRILNDHVAIDSDLYVSIFDSSKDINDVDCYGGVRGESNVAQFCLPFGQCLKKNSDGTSEKQNRDKDIFLGKGNIGVSFGGINRDRGMVLNLPTDEKLKKYTGKTKFISQRWYER
ncbi:MAG: PilC/PilY family type IV pilus protein [Anaerovoracaceae bacterium]